MVACIYACSPNRQPSPFIHIVNGQFIKDNAPYYYIGANFWYGAILASEGKGGLLAGANFWGWGGFAVPSTGHIFWQKGDDYTGDPAQEEQGLNSVFATDTTIEIINKVNSKLQGKSE